MNNQELFQKRKEAKKLYVNELLTAKAVCEQIGISEKTMSKWVKMYGWKGDQKLLKSENDTTFHPDTIALLKYQIFMQGKHPELYQKIKDSINEYLQLKA